MDWYCAECGKKIAKPLPEYEYHNYDYQREEIEGGKRCSVCGRELCGECADWDLDDTMYPVCVDCKVYYSVEEE